MNFVDILKNANVTPGFGGIMYFCPIDNIDVDSFPDPGADTMLISTAFTIKPTMSGFVKVPISTVGGKAAFDQEKAGDSDNPVRNDTMSVFHKGSDPVTSFHLNKLNGTECIVLLREKQECTTGSSPVYQMIGNKCQGIYLTATFGNNGEQKGYTITGEGFATTLPLFYDAAIPAGV